VPRRANGKADSLPPAEQSSAAGGGRHQAQIGGAEREARRSLLLRQCGLARTPTLQREERGHITNY